MSLDPRRAPRPALLVTVACLGACAARSSPPFTVAPAPAPGRELRGRFSPLRLASYVGIAFEETRAYRELQARRDCADTWMHTPYFREVVDRAAAGVDPPIEANRWLNDGQDTDLPTADVLARARQVGATVVLLARRRLRLDIEDAQGQLYCRVTGTGTLALLAVATGATLAGETITRERIQAAGGESDAYAAVAAALLQRLRGDDGVGAAGRDAPRPAAPVSERAASGPPPAALPPACAERVVTGDYAISDPASVRQLAGVTRIAGGLTIRGTGLRDLRGLECLARVDGMLDIRENASLASLAGLEGLTEVRGSVVVGQNPALASLVGLGNLTRATAVQLAGNAALATLAGLERLVACDVYLIVQDHPLLVSLAGLEALRSPGESLLFLNNGSLSTCAIDELVARLRRDRWAGQLQSEGNQRCER